MIRSEKPCLSTVSEGKEIHMMKKWIALLLTFCLLPVFGLAEETGATEDEISLSDGVVVHPDEWTNFLLICNEGMNNSGGNAGNTLSVVAINPKLGKIHLMMFTWDTFIDYEGYEVPQRIDMPYRNNGPEEVMKVFDDNFNLDISLFMSLNYLNLANLIDAYGGVTVDISRAERNALNGMVSSKKRDLQNQIGTGLLSQAVVDMLAEEYYLNEFGPDTHLNGLQAVGFGWLQYDSVYNCCLRDAKVIGNLFHSVSETLSQRMTLITDETEDPQPVPGKRMINLDQMTEDDYTFLRREVAPIFEMSYHNLSEENIHDITLALARIAYAGAKQGVDIFTAGLETMVLPLEARNEYDIVAGAKGHLIDKQANIEAIEEFLYKED